MYFCTMGGITMLNYYNSFEKNGIIYSIDMCRYTFKLDISKKKELEEFLFKNYSNLRYFQSYKNFSYRHLFTADDDDFASFKLGISFNGINSSNDINKCFLEFNPNKSMAFVSDLIDFLNYCCYGFELVRFDFAIDISVRRDYVFLIKDRRDYSKYRVLQKSIGSFDVTEYLGQRNQNGFVRLYNKTIESGLNYDLTRLELTLESVSYDNFVKCLPKLCYYSNSFNIGLNDTDRVLIDLMAMSNCFESLKYLGRKKAEKLLELFKYDVININSIEFLNVIQFLLTMFNSVSFSSKKK